MQIDRSIWPGLSGIAARVLLIATMAVTATGGISAQNQDAGAPASVSGNAASQVAWIQYLAAELRRLQIELLEDRRDLQQARLQDLERDLESIQTRQQEIQEEQRSQTQRAAEIDGQLLQSNLSNPERAELEAQKADLLAQSPARFGTAQSALTQQETRARERLALQEQRVRAIDRQISELSAPPK